MRQFSTKNAFGWSAFPDSVDRQPFGKLGNSLALSILRHYARTGTAGRKCSEKTGNLYAFDSFTS